MKSVIVKRKDMPEEVLENFACLFAVSGFEPNVTVDYYPNGTNNKNEDYEVNRYTALKDETYALDIFYCN